MLSLFYRLFLFIPMKKKTTTTIECVCEVNLNRLRPATFNDQNKQKRFFLKRLNFIYKCIAIVLSFI